MKKKNLSVLTFMSWDNEVGNKNKTLGTIRAIALCDEQGYFVQAINCMRDSQMGEKDKNGVYQRIWASDYIENSDHENLRPATQEEIALYLKYVSLEAAAGLDEPNTNVKIVCKCFGTYTSHVIVEITPLHWWKKLMNKVRRNRLPF